MSAMTAIHRRLKGLADAEHARVLQRFFKTAPGEYGAGDRFLGIRMPALRRAAHEFKSLELSDLSDLLESSWHEERALALLVLVEQYERGDGPQREAIYRLYLAKTSRINNWDLVDLSAEHIIGAHLLEGDRKPLIQLAKSESVWNRRIAIMATFHYIKRGEFADTLRLAKLLINDRHALVHKAVGWMLREVGKRDRHRAERFLRAHANRMPRTMLRYAIERLPENLRRRYLSA